MDFSVSGVDVPIFLSPIITFVISFFTSMGGVSGAFLLLPFQVSVLGFSSPAVSSTNLVYNIVATPSGVYRYIKEKRMAWPLAWVVISGTLPGVFLGAIVRIKYLPEPGTFKLFVGCVLLYIGIQLLYQTTGRQHKGREKSSRVLGMESKFNQMVKISKERQKGLLKSGLAPEAVVKTVRFSLGKYEYEFWGERYSFNSFFLFVIALVVGIIGGAYGIGGGSIIAPFCVAILGLPVYTVAGAVLLGTFITSIAGVSCYYIAAFSIETQGLPVTPDWTLGLLFGIGGFIGMYCGARAQKFIPERLIKLVLGLLIISLSIRYILQFFV